MAVLTAEALGRVYGVTARIERDGDVPLIVPTGRVNR